MDGELSQKSFFPHGYGSPGTTNNQPDRERITQTTEVIHSIVIHNSSTLYRDHTTSLSILLFLFIVSPLFDSKMFATTTTARTGTTNTRGARGRSTTTKKTAPPAPLVVFDDTEHLKIYDRVFLGDKDIAKDFQFMSNNHISHVLNVSSIKNHFEQQQQHGGASTRKKTTTVSAIDDDNDVSIQQQQQQQDDKENMIGRGQQTRTTAEQSLEYNNSNSNSSNQQKNSIELTKNHGLVVQQQQEQAGLGKLPLTQQQLKQQHRPITYLKINIDDSMDTDIKSHFDRATRFIHDALQQQNDNNDNNDNDKNNSCLVHCKEGKSRSVTMLIAYGMRFQNMTLEQSYNNIMQVTNGRPRMNDGFKRQLMEYELELMREASIKSGGGSEETTNHLVNSLDFFPSRRRKRTVRAYDENGHVIFIESNEASMGGGGSSSSSSSRSTPTRGRNSSTRGGGRTGSSSRDDDEVGDNVQSMQSPTKKSRQSRKSPLSLSSSAAALPTVPDFSLASLR